MKRAANRPSGDLTLIFVYPRRGVSDEIAPSCVVSFGRAFYLRGEGEGFRRRIEPALEE